MSAVISTPSPTVDLAAVKNKQHLAWSSGDYAVVGTTLQIVGESLCEALDLHAGERVLDVAAGNGNATLAAARRWCDVVSTDYVPTLLERGRGRASAEGLQVRFEQADVENLPYTDHSFDVVLSTFGVMFTPDQEKAEFVFRYHSAAHWLEVFRTFYGPMYKAFGALDAEKQESLANDLVALAESFNRASDGTLAAPSEYIEVVIRRR
jgi:SAM-dependent methyltransferase